MQDGVKQSEMKSCLNFTKIAISSTVWLIAFSILSVVLSFSLAQNTPQVPGKLLVGVADFPPYAIKTEDGKWVGFSIELWQAAAKELGIGYKLKEFSRLRQVAEAIQKEELVVTPAMAVAEYNETVMDLSHSYHRSLFQMFFRVQGQLDHALEKFVCLHPREIVTNEFFTKQAAYVTELAAFLFAGIYKIPVAVVYNDHIFFEIEFCTPHFTGCPAVSIPGKPFIRFSGFG